MLNPLIQQNLKFTSLELRSTCQVPTKISRSDRELVPQLVDPVTCIIIGQWVMMRSNILV